MITFHNPNSLPPFFHQQRKSKSLLGMLRDAGHLTQDSISAAKWNSDAARTDETAPRRASFEHGGEEWGCGGGAEFEITPRNQTEVYSSAPHLLKPLITCLFSL